eukprot:gene21085-25315_t
MSHKCRYVGWVETDHHVYVAAGVDPFSEDLGEPTFDADFDMSDPATQESMWELCTKLATDGVSRGLVIAVKKCWVNNFKIWVEYYQVYTFPVPQHLFPRALKEFLAFDPYWQSDIGVLQSEDDRLPSWIVSVLSGQFQDSATRARDCRMKVDVRTTVARTL